MSTYNQIAGRSADRLGGLSDGVFAVAMTLLVLDLHSPVAEAVHSERDLLLALADLAPRLLVYMMSFLTLGIFWVGQQTQLNFIAQTDRHLSWIHLAFLFGVSLMPFSTLLLGGFHAYRTALLLYWLNILLLGALLYAGWSYAARANLLRPETPPGTGRHVRRRIVVAQALYAVGAALCVIDTSWSIAAIAITQFNYAVAPRLGVLSRI